MKPSDNHAFVNQILICVLVAICGGGSIGLGTVWMRNQISVTANVNRALAVRIENVERRITETKALVDMEQSPDVLRQRNADWQLGLVLLNDAQIVHVAGDPVRSLAARGNRGLFTDRPAGLVFRVAMEP